MPAPKNPVLISLESYRKAIVRQFTEELREIEGRLEQPSAPRWSMSLGTCEDITGVAKLLLALQKRSTLNDASHAWLEELAHLSAAEIDMRAIELVRSLAPTRAPSSAPLVGAPMVTPGAMASIR